MGSPGQVNAQVGSILLNGGGGSEHQLQLDHARRPCFHARRRPLGRQSNGPAAASGGLSSVTARPRRTYAINLIGTLTGSADAGSYSGTLNVQPVRGAVPEPATWAMMLLGFAGVGFAMRRRRQPVLAQIA